MATVWAVEEDDSGARHYGLVSVHATRDGAFAAAQTIMDGSTGEWKPEMDHNGTPRSMCWVCGDSSIVARQFEVEP